jgi:hypothetical protein
MQSFPKMFRLSLAMLIRNPLQVLDDVTAAPGRLQVHMGPESLCTYCNYWVLVEVICTYLACIMRSEEYVRQVSTSERVGSVNGSTSGWLSGATTALCFFCVQFTRFSLTPSLVLLYRDTIEDRYPKRPHPFLDSPSNCHCLFACWQVIFDDQPHATV